ncbi:hypothetical protein LINPERPRIM_LOCUS32881 [Linum perenne]
MIHWEMLVVRVVWSAFWQLEHGCNRWLKDGDRGQGGCSMYFLSVDIMGILELFRLGSVFGFVIVYCNLVLNYGSASTWI